MLLDRFPGQRGAKGLLPSSGISAFCYAYILSLNPNVSRLLERAEPAILSLLTHFVQKPYLSYVFLQENLRFVVIYGFQGSFTSPNRVLGDICCSSSPNCWRINAIQLQPAQAPRKMRLAEREFLLEPLI